jgi:restriction system protein
VPRRQKRNHGGELVAVFVLLGALWSISFPGQFQNLLITLFWIAVVGSAVIVMVAFLHRNAKPSLRRARIREPVWSDPESNVGTLKSDAGLRNVFSAFDEKKPGQWSCELLRSLDWKRFEEVCAAYFVAKGHDARVTDLGADGGIDVLLYSPSIPEKVLGIVQCKAWSQKPIGVKEIRELLGVMTHIGCPLGVYVATTEFTQAAQDFAENKHIKLITADKFLDLILKLPADDQEQLLEVATEGDYTTPSCPSCGMKLISRTARKGMKSGNKFWGCPNYPRCHYTMPARAA